ncbi:MAG: cysteine--tRNA ligase [Candidatus Pacebacteria bacterium]|nr:cysteine--tRNA ligase [Candidatus Paceibacterota bacterium]
MIKIFNSLSGQKENLPDNRPLRLFVCGPTVYDVAHLGHARTFIAFDSIVHYLKSQGIPVNYLQNITDVDDKIIKRAAETNIAPIALARRFEKEYHEDEKSLGIDSVSKYARATDHIAEIIKQIQTLVKKGNAYKIENEGYYFNISTFPEYGKLSKRTAEQAEDATSRIDEGINKKNKGDFALWKFPKIKIGKDQSGKSFAVIGGEPLWNTELGWGRPGWHIEDTAITEHYFGPQYEIHGGAIELKFPHHEAEIAQQESASGKNPMVKIWIHTGILLINGEKMSKSLGNFITISDFLKKYPANILRYIIANHHYRSPINYTEQLAIEAQKNISGINEFLTKISLTKKGESPKLDIEKYEKSFSDAMEDDLNMPKAIASIFELMNEINSNLSELNKNDAKKASGWIIKKLGLLKITVKKAQIPLKIRFLAWRRKLLRDNKHFAQSDLLRKKIEALGYSIEDTPLGTLVLPKI